MAILNSVDEEPVRPGAHSEMVISPQGIGNDGVHVVLELVDFHQVGIVTVIDRGRGDRRHVPGRTRHEKAQADE